MKKKYISFTKEIIVDIFKDKSGKKLLKEKFDLLTVLNLWILVLKV